MLNELELDKKIQDVFIDEEYYKGIVIDYFNQYCLKVFNKTYDYNVSNIRVFLYDLFRIEEESNGSFYYLKTKEEVDERDGNYRYVSILDFERISNIQDFIIYVEQQLER